MNKTDYIDDLDVKGFVGYLRNVIVGKIDCAHQYKISMKAWNSYRRKVGQVPDQFTVEKFREAFSEYWWHGNYVDNKKQLDMLSRSLGQHLKGRCDEKTLFVECVRALEWGQVYKGAVTWLLEALDQGDLCNRVQYAVKIFDGNNDANINLFSEDLRSDSGMTKIYSLASNNSIIYDDRVGAALGLLVRRYLLQETNHKKVPVLLNFMRGSTQDRNPSKNEYKFRRKKAGSHHAMSNLRANWVLSAAMPANYAGYTKPAEKLRAIEATLFMLGSKVA